MIPDPALFVSSVILAVYAVFALICWAFNIKHTRVAPVLAVALAACAAAGYMLFFAVRW